MNSSLARTYLMRALAMSRAKRKPEIDAKIKALVLAGKCIAAGCDGKLRSRGLCDKCRQKYYSELESRDPGEPRLQMEEEAIKQGLILADGEQLEVRRKASNPFASVG